MKITKSELKELIKESLNNNIRKIELLKKINSIEKELAFLNENEGMPTLNQTNEYSNIAPKETESQDSQSIYDVAKNPGSTIILNFEGVTIKLQKQFEDLFKVVDAENSGKLEEGDYVKLKGNDTLEEGKVIEFEVYRRTELKYKTNPLQSWKGL
jgi:hypothetical protein